MSEENKTECCEKKCECKKMIKEFLCRVTAVFIGTLLAIIVAASLLKPAPFPGKGCPMMGKPPVHMQNMGYKSHKMHKRHKQGPHHEKSFRYDDEQKGVK